MTNPGRKTKYTADIDILAYRHALHGLTDKEMATVFGIAEQTWYNWQAKHPTLTRAIQRGRIQADTKVAEALYKRAIGYEYEEEVAHVINGQVVVTKLKKHQPPHPTAVIFWLKNRTGRPHNIQEFSWRDVYQSEVTGKDGGPIRTENINHTALDLSGLTDAELAVMESIGIKVEKVQVEKAQEGATK